MTGTHRLGIVVTLLLCISLIGTPSAHATILTLDEGAALPPTLIRMHVIAHSDQPDDQLLKDLVRADLISFLADSRLADPGLTFTEARSALHRYVPTLEQVARRRLAAEGSDQDVRVRLGRFSYDERTYHGLVIPSGEYVSVEVMLGDAQGRNFWCILFPGMCFVPDEVQELAQERAKGNVAEAAALQAEETKRKGGSVFRFSWLWLDRLFGPSAVEVAQSGPAN